MPTRRDTTRYRREEGMALISVLLLLMLVSGLCATLTVSGQTEAKASFNLDNSVQARAAAQAGLTAGVQAAVTALNSSSASTPSGRINELLDGPDNDPATTGDNGSLAPYGLPAPGVRAQLGSLTRVHYEVRVFDDDDSNRGMTVSSATITQIEENSSATTDANEAMVIRAIGYGINGTTVTMEAIIGVTQLPAIVTDGNLTINGNVTVQGQNGGVHSNGYLDIDDASVSIAENATASVGIEVHTRADIGETQGLAPEMAVPAVHASDHLTKADYILGRDGMIRDRATNAVLCDASSTATACDAVWGWRFEGVVGVTGDWSVHGNNLHNGTYYVEGNATMSGSPGTSGSPISLSIIAEGNIDISGNPDVQPDAPELLFVTDGDLQISGGLSTPILIEGQVLVREQMSITGNVEIAGQILVDNAASLSSLVTETRLAGTTTITYNGIAGAGTFSVGGWREIK